MPKRRRGGIRRRGSASFGSLSTLLVAVLATILGLLVAAKFIPANWALAGGLGIAGAASYALDGHRTGMALLGAAVGVAAAPAVAGMLGGGGSNQSTAMSGQVWA